MGAARATRSAPSDAVALGEAEGETTGAVELPGAAGAGATGSEADGAAAEFPDGPGDEPHPANASVTMTGSSTPRRIVELNPYRITA